MTRKAIFYRHIRDWYYSFDSFLTEKESKGMHVVCIAVSRKMPRLCQWIEKEFGVQIFNRVTIVSEHALPFYLPTLVNNRKIEVLIIDDAIYEGTSIENIASSVVYMLKKKPSILTVFDYSEFFDCYYGKSLNKLKDSKNEAPFNNALEAEYVWEIGEPNDIEFPVFSCESSNPPTKEYTLSTLLANQSVNNIYTTSPYGCYTQETRYNISVLLSQLKEEYCDDFSKIRLFVSSNRVNLAIYSPVLLSEPSVLANQVFEKGSFLWDIWEMTTKVIYQNMFKRADDFSPLGLSWKRRSIRSLVVWANYLISLSFYQNNKVMLDIALKMLGYNFPDAPRTKELTLLIGPQNENIIRSLGRIQGNIMLNNSFNTNTIVFPTEETDMNITNYCNNIWSEFRSYYDILSSIFHNLRILYSYKGFDTNLIRENNQYGITLGWLQKKTNVYFSELDPNALHQWIDEQIDCYSVHPNYVRERTRDGVVWKRMFQAGHTGDSLIYIASLALFVFRCYKEIANTDRIEEHVLENLMSIVTSNSNFVDINFWLRNKVRHKNYIGVIKTIIDENSNCSITEYLLNHRLLERLEHGVVGKVMLIDGTSYHLQGLQSADIIDKDEEEKIKRFIEFYCTLTKNSSRKLLYSFLPIDENEYLEECHKRISEWINLTKNNIQYIYNCNTQTIIEDFKNSRDSIIDCVIGLGVIDVNWGLHNNLSDKQFDEIKSRTIEVITNNQQKIIALANYLGNISFLALVFYSAFILRNTNEAIEIINRMQGNVHISIDSKVLRAMASVPGNSEYIEAINWFKFRFEESLYINF